ncbi:ComEC/Rec2 family competence protein [Oribacterium sp. WCC10]|uniref:ComEC/Rec2 family competence protein n=1 Tax=Oribacterium sp. WCC10 TaxID=1855343 RepID=UPI0008E3CFCF|nr:ComEC/Rec2 family competence protein [Oribacterium sp. WCC10]SFG39233.1 competence protein ComEC [Oribacterium sp. WCC10]
MNYKRPMLLIAMVFVLGVCVTAVEAGLYLNVSAGVLFCGVLSHGIISKRLVKRMAAILLAVFLTGTLRYRYDMASLDLYKTNIQKFDGLKVCLQGTVDSHTSSLKNDRIVIKNAVLSNAYGSSETLPEDAPLELKERYDQSVGDIMVYLKNSDTSYSSSRFGKSGSDKTGIRKNDENDIVSDKESDIQSPYPGEMVKIYGTMIQDEGVRNEGQFDFGLYYRTLGISGSMYGDRLEITGGEPEPFRSLLQKARNWVCKRLELVSEERDLGIYKALLVGDKSSMDEEIRELYQDNGIAHILAVSGLHLSIIGAGFYDFLRRCGSTKRFSGVLSAILILSYGIFTGCSGSAMRAVIMLLIRFLGEAIGRQYDMLSALACACILLLIGEPYMIFSSGFQLSFMAVLSLGTGAILPFPKEKTLNGICMSLFLQIMTLPVIIYHFFRFPLYGMMLNFLVLPLMNYVIYSGLLAIALSFASVLTGAAALASGHYILSFYNYLCHQTSDLPFSSLLLGRPKISEIIVYYTMLFFLLVLTLYLKDQRKKGRLKGIKRKIYYELPGIWLISLMIACRVLLPKIPAGIEITCIDVGQGDGFIIRHNDLVLTVDCGSSSDKKLAENRLVPYLESQGIGRINMAFITHCDSDHYSGMIDILNNEDGIVIDELCLPFCGKEDERYDKLRNAAEGRGTKVSYFGTGSVVESDDLRLTGLYPLDGGYISEANSHSIGMLLSYGEFKMLFTGDMDKECERKMLEYLKNCSWRMVGDGSIYNHEDAAGGLSSGKDLKQYGHDEGDLPDIDIIKLGHHGSSTSTSEELLKYMKPECAIISYGAGNDYGHPHRETVGLMKSYGISMYETAKMGEIRIVSDGERYKTRSLLKESIKKPAVG